VRPEELDPRPAGAAEVREWYENRTSMEGRYRVMEALDGTGPGLITGSTVYREIDDFAGLTGVRYRYSPYLLEAVMHLVNFYIVMRDEAETRKMIPAGLGQMRFTRRCQPGEKVYLQARLAQEDARGYTWNAQARDEIGLLLMQVTGLEMKWFGG
jgi:hypothetical protein